MELLKLLHDQPQVTQRGLARALGVSVGKANYCLKSLVAKGLVRLERNRASADKRRYVYLLTAAGVKAKTRITKEFLRDKVSAYDALGKEIVQLRGELKSRGVRAGVPSERQAGSL